MTLSPLVEHDVSALDIDRIEDQIYAHNRSMTGKDDALSLAFVMRDDARHIIGACAG